MLRVKVVDLFLAQEVSELEVRLARSVLGLFELLLDRVSRAHRVHDLDVHFDGRREQRVDDPLRLLGRVRRVGDRDDVRPDRRLDLGQHLQDGAGDLEPLRLRGLFLLRRLALDPVLDHEGIAPQRPPPAVLVLGPLRWRQHLVTTVPEHEDICAERRAQHGRDQDERQVSARAREREADEALGEALRLARVWVVGRGVVHRVLGASGSVGNGII